MENNISAKPYLEKIIKPQMIYDYHGERKSMSNEKDSRAMSSSRAGYNKQAK